MENIKNTFNNILKNMTNNQMIYSVVTILLVLYSALAAPKLPKSFAKIFENPLVKILYMFLIGYLATKNPTISMMAAVALFLTLQALASHDVADAVATSYNQVNQLVNNQVNQPVNNQVNNVQETVQEVPTMEVPLSPRRAEIVSEATALAEVHKEEAVKATNPVVAEVHKQEAIKQELLAEAAVKEKAHLIEAEKASSKGDMVTAEAHKEAASKEEVKVTALLIAQEEKTQAIQQEKFGNVVSAEEHRNNAAKQETLVNALVKSEVHKSAALQESNPVIAETHKQEAIKNDIIAESIIKSEGMKRDAVIAESKGQMQVAQELHKDAAREEVKAKSLVVAAEMRELAIKAISEGNVVKAEEHKRNAQVQEMKAESLVRVEEIKELAKQVPAEAETLLKIAKTEEKKVNEIIKAENDTKMAVVAKMEGNHEVAVKLEENAKVHNDKANLLNVAQEHQLNALEEQRQGNVAKAEELKKQAKAIIKQVRNIPLPHIIRNNYGLVPVSDTESETHEPLVHNAHVTTLSGYEIGNYAML
jgi:hypothetical protein